jgi:PAS domain S-box-containing protein
MDSSSVLRFGPFLGASLFIVGLIEAKRSVEEARRKVAAQVERSEAYLAEAQKLSRSGSWASLSDRFEPTYWSAEMFRMIGLPPSENPPSMQQVAALFAPEAWARMAEIFQAARVNKTTLDGEFPLISRDGVERIVRIVGHPVLGASGEILEFVGTVIDITEQREARAALQRAFDEIKGSEDRLRLIIDTIPTLAWSTRPDGMADFYNQRWLDYTGLSAEQALDSGWRVAIHPDDLNSLLGYWQSLIASGESGETEARLRGGDGEYRWFLFRGCPLRDNSGKVVKWYGINTDIEDRKQAADAVRASELNFRTIVHRIPGLVATMTPEGAVELVNRPVLDYTGMRLEDLKNWSTTLVPEEDSLRVTALWKWCVETGNEYDLEHRLRRADGVCRWFHVRGLPLRDNEGRIVRWYCLMTDIEDRKRAEEALRSREQQFRSMLDCIPAL